MSTELVGLDLDLGNGTIAEKIRRAGQARALRDFAAEVFEWTRTDLEADAHADVKRAGGGGFSRTVDGVRATLTDPKPKPHVTDPEAFGGWLAEYTKLEVETVERVEVLDHAAAIAGQGLLDAIDDDPTSFEPDDYLHCAHVLADCLKVTTETALPSKSLDTVLAGKHGGPPVTIVNNSRMVWVDTATGEMHDVPGVKVSPPADPVIQVTPDDAAKATNRALVASYFGLPAQLPKGADA